MAIATLNHQDGILRSISDLPPTHYTVKIQLFSLLTKNNIEKYESGEFEAGGYKWYKMFLIFIIPLHLFLFTFLTFEIN